MDAKVSEAIPTHVSLKELQEDPANVRRTDLAPSPALTASIAAHGVLVPLLVREAARGGYLVLDGGKRLRALRGLKTSPAELIPIRLLHGDAVAARAASLSVAIIRDELHPVDRYEAFAQMIADGKTRDDLMRDFALGELEVKQVLALGGLSPLIRKAWREGDIAADTARRFTLAADHKHQDATYKRLLKDRHGVREWEVRQALQPKDREVPRLLGYVGVGPYRDAGGEVIEDLFPAAYSERGDSVSDPALLRKLADEKLAAAVASRLAEGWSWAEVDEDGRASVGLGSLPHRLPKLSKADAATVKAHEKKIEAIDRKLDSEGEGNLEDNPEAMALQDEIDAIRRGGQGAAYTAAEKAKAGCFVSIGDNFQTEIRFGVLRGEAARGAGKIDEHGLIRERAKAKPSGAISAALGVRLSEALTLAAGDALMTDVRLALAVLVAGFEAVDHKVGVRLEVMISGRAGTGHPAKRAGLESALAALDELTTADLNEALAGIAAKALNFQSWNSVAPGATHAAKMILDRVPGPALSAALLKRFDPKDYFASVNGAVARAALKDMGLDAPASARKAELVTRGANAALLSRWLPKELRTKHYPGHAKLDPGEATGKPASASKAPAAGKAPAKAGRRAGAAPAKRARAK